MVKIGKAFSIFAVFTLLILLAPAVVLTGGNVAQGSNGEAVTEEIEATFSFSVDSGGDWYAFEAGSGGLQPDPGDARLALVQYTRQNVVLRGTTVPGCGFRNYTTGSGTVTSTLGNLNGTMTLEWITFRFNMTYTHEPIYMTANDFGWMMARGHYCDEGNSANNFTFMFIADFDCNDGMTVAAGEGSMQSVEENGRFGDMSDSIENRSHIMGGFDIALSGGIYTGNFTLRNYPPNEVYDAGMLNITGGVMQEFTDDIHPIVEMMNVTSDGPMSTPYDEEKQPGFEEIDWGKDPTKTIVESDRLGKNGTMDITRNSVMYLMESVNLTDNRTYITIQVNPVCILYINDTATGVRADDRSAYGELWEYLVLSLPLQYLPLGDYFTQDGYTWCPFDTVNGQPTAQTGCYAGAESFADAFIRIESAVGAALQDSTDTTYGLYAHPKVDKVFPSNGFPGTTMDVKIYGKYFLRADGQKSGWIANSGSVDFGPNITVHSYTIMNDSPIDNCIRANITIAGGAGAGAQVVNVTSCFGYDNTTGTPTGAAGPYKSGFGTFNIVTEGATLNGTVTLAGRGIDPSAKKIESFVVKTFEPGNLDFEVWSGTASTNESGVFTIPGLLPETYDIGIKNCTCLSEVATGEDLTTPVDFGRTREGDVKETDRVDWSDFLKLKRAYLTEDSDEKWNPNADLNRSGLVDWTDFLMLKYNYLADGAAMGHF